MRTHLISFLTASLIVNCAHTFAQTTPAHDIAAQAHDRVAALVENQELVGTSAAIAIDGRIVWSEAFGWEDREADIPATLDTMYRWASISKPLTAVVAMQLANEGRLDLDADIRTVVPEFPEKPYTITSRQLLCHQGGIVHYSNGPVIHSRVNYNVSHPFEDVVVALDDFKESPLVAEPGTTYSYTTRGYMLLGAVCQKAANEPYWQLVHQRIVEPLHLTTLQPDYQWIDIDHSAVGYKKRGDDIVRSTDTDVSWKLPGGGFISTVEDLTGFGMGLCTNELLTDDLKSQMWTRQQTRDGKETGYGLGFSVTHWDMTLVVSHSGSQEKARTYLIVLPEENVVAAIMTNSEWANLGKATTDLAKFGLEHTTSDADTNR
ncbi:MAG: beta-lactamase family protein [Phycisphaeraceae bacterium]|nr:beta-lactamase family protein [Phycisphaerales bacterium]MCB9861558.1 beta-lactamase family protein [Phycisphaeraceae bacterium]